MDEVEVVVGLFEWWQVHSMDVLQTLTHDDAYIQSVHYIAYLITVAASEGVVLAGASVHVVLVWVLERVVELAPISVLLVWYYNYFRNSWTICIDHICSCCCFRRLYVDGKVSLPY